MSKLTSPATKPTNGGAEKSLVPMMIQAVLPKTEKAPEALEQKKEIPLGDKIRRIEQLKLIIDKREKLMSTRCELEKFQISSNDFNCSMRLSDSDGNVFNTKILDFRYKYVVSLLRQTNNNP